MTGDRASDGPVPSITTTPEPVRGVDLLNMELVNKAAEAYLKTAEGPDAARLRFLKGLWEIQSTIEAEYGEASGEADGGLYTALDAKAAREALTAGRSLFHVNAPDVPLDTYLDAVSRVVAYVSEEAGLPAEQADALRDADFTDAITDDRLAQAAAAPSAFASDMAARLDATPEDDLTPATVAFVLLSALTPLLSGPARIAMDSLGEFDGRSQSAGTCPVCGEPASLSRVGESTQLQGADRTLWCGVCHTEWGYERIRCVRCGTRSPKALSYKYVEGDPAHRVHLCDECRGYVRTVFLSDLDKPLSLVVEDPMSTTLDAVASGMGYSTTGDGGCKSC